MKIEEIKVLRGTNYWSVRRPKLIQMKLTLEELEERQKHRNGDEHDQPREDADHDHHDSENVFRIHCG